MAVPITGTGETFTGTGVSSVYAPEFYASSSAQVVVHADGVLQTIGDDYVVNNVGSSSGVTITATFTLGAVVLVERVTPLTQLVDTQNNETILEDVIDAGFDKLTMIAQEQAALLASTIEDLAVVAQAISGQVPTSQATATATEVIPAGAFVNTYEVGGLLRVRRADQSDPDKYARGFALRAIASGTPGLVSAFGLNTAAVPATAGEVWLGTAGGFTAVEPSISGNIYQSLGVPVPGVGIFFFPPQNRVLVP